jgi:hypothetical protein
MPTLDQSPEQSGAKGDMAGRDFLQSGAGVVGRESAELARPLAVVDPRRDQCLSLVSLLGSFRQSLAGRRRQLPKSSGVTLNGRLPEARLLVSLARKNPANCLSNRLLGFSVAAGLQNNTTSRFDGYDVLETGQSVRSDDGN